VKRLVPLCLLLLLVPLTAAAQANVPHYTRVLIPIYYEKPIHGAFDSVWTTQFSVYNSGGGVVNMGWCTVGHDSEACIVPRTAETQIAAGATATTLPAFSPFFNDSVPGRQLHFETVDDSQLSFGLRVADTSRSASTAGTEIPVIREADYRRAAVNLPNVPIDPRFRLTLRIYEMTLPTADFNVSVFDQQSNALLGSSKFHLVAPMTGAFRYEPAYVQLADLNSIVPSGTTMPAAVRVVVTPTDEASRFWAFISITNNDTQQLTLITPQ
jgi:hypothetical protein